MPSLSDTQEAFALGLLQPDQPVPVGVNGPGPEVPQRRYNVYRNNVAVSLVDALAATFPAVERLVGEEFFRAAAREFVLDSPPTTPVLIEYGDKFAEFIECFAPADSVPYLADVARIEWAWNRAYHARDAKIADISVLRTVPEDRVGEIRIKLHPSVSLLRSQWPAVSLWADRPETDGSGAIDLNQGEDALVVRPLADVDVRILPAGAYRFFKSLGAGQTLTSAADAAMSDCSEFDLSENLSGLFSSGSVAAIQPVGGAASR